MKKYQWLTLSLVSICFTSSFAQADSSVPAGLQGNFTAANCQIQQGNSYLSMSHVENGTNVQFAANGSDINMTVTKNGGSWGILTFANINGSAKVNKSYDPFPFGCTGSSESATASDSQLIETNLELSGFSCSKTNAINKASITANSDGSLTYSELDTRDGAVTYQVTCTLRK